MSADEESAPLDAFRLDEILFSAFATSAGVEKSAHEVPSNFRDPDVIETTTGTSETVEGSATDGVTEGVLDSANEGLPEGDLLIVRLG